MRTKVQLRISLVADDDIGLRKMYEFRVGIMNFYFSIKHSIKHSLLNIKNVSS